MRRAKCGARIALAALGLGRWIVHKVLGFCSRGFCGGCPAGGVLGEVSLLAVPLFICWKLLLGDEAPRAVPQ